MIRQSNFAIVVDLHITAKAKKNIICKNTCVYAWCLDENKNCIEQNVRRNWYNENNCRLRVMIIVHCITFIIQKPIIKHCFYYCRKINWQKLCLSIQTDTPQYETNMIGSLIHSVLLWMWSVNTKISSSLFLTDLKSIIVKISSCNTHI